MSLVKNYKGKPIVIKKDLEQYLGIKVNKYMSYLKPSIEFNGLGQGTLRENFEEYNKAFYKEETIIYLSLIGALKIIKILIDNKLIQLDINKLRNRLEQNLILNFEGGVV